MDTVIDMPRVSGSKGFGKGSSGSSGGHEDPNTLRSNVRARIVDLVGEGVFEGWVSDDPRKDIFFDRTPIMNEDGSLNFQGVTVDYRLGHADQEELKGFPMVEAPYSVNTRVYKNQGPVVRTIADRDATSVRVIVTIPSLNYTNKTEKFAGLYKAEVNYAFDIKTATGDWVEAINVTINDKCTSPYQRAHRLDLPAGGFPWQVRMRRISPDSTDEALQNQTLWDSYVEVVEARLTYMHSAVVAIEVDARQFGSSVPSRSYRMKARRWPVPSNYDPIARTYNGIWDGTWVEKWTNNPAYVFRGLALQDRFGLGEFIDRTKFDDAGIYQIGRYCDQTVDDGYGRQIPRYTYNGAINTFKEAHKALQDIAATFRGMSFWSLGQIFAVADMPKDPVLLVTKANTIGGFEYSSTAMKARHTAASIAWNDPADFFKPAIELYRDADGVRQLGWRQADLQLEGCSVRAQAFRMGAWLVDTELNEFETVTYRASFDHAALDRADVITGLLPGDIIQIADPRKMRIRAGGRVAGAISTTRVQLDAPFAMVAGQTYRLRVTRPNGKIAEAPISEIDADNVATLASPLPEIPLVEAVWIISGTDAAPRQYRVLEIAEEAKNVFRVTGLFYDPTKYARVEQGIKLPAISYTRPRTQIAPPTNLAVRESQYFRDGQPRTRLTLSWTPGNDFMSAGYLITAQTPSGFQSYGETGAPVIDIDDAQPGEYVFTVVGRSNTPGVFSPPVDFTHEAKGWAGAAGPTISNLRVQGGGATFTGRDASLLWDVIWPADAQTYDIDFVVRVLDAGTDQVVRVTSTSASNWSYTFETNANDGRASGMPGPRRALKVRVSARDLLGRETAPATITITNPAPEIIVPTLGSTSEVLFVDLPNVADADFAGYLVWISETPGINPLTAPSFDVASSSFPYRGVPDKTYYVRAAAYDAFSKDPAQLNISVEQSRKLTSLLFNPEPPSIPGQPFGIENVIEVAPDGTATSRIVLGWPAVTSENLGYYEVWVAEGVNPPEARYVGGRTTEATVTSMSFTGLMPGQTYNFMVRAHSKNGLAVSERSPVLAVLAAANTVAPSLPTGFTVESTVQSAHLAWTNPPEKDLRGIEVWAAPVGDGAQATRIAEIAAPSTFYIAPLDGQDTRWFWIRAVNTSDYFSGFVGPQQATNPLITAAQLAADIAEQTMVAGGIVVNKVVTSLPTARTYDQVTFEGRVYKWDAATGRYIPLIQAADIDGKVIAAQIDTVNKEAIASALAQSQVQTSQLAGNLDATRIAGQLTADQITNRAITAAKFAEGLDAIQTVDALPNLATWDGPAFVRLRSDSKLYRISNGAWTKNIDIADTVGTVPEGRLPAFNAANLYGTLDQARIASIAASKIEAGLTADQIASVHAARVSGQLTSATIQASQLLGSITKTQITDGAVTTPKIEAGAVTASKLDIVSSNFAYNPNYMFGIRGWTLDYTNAPTAVVTGTREDYCPAGTKCFMAHFPGTAQPGSLVQIRHLPINNAGVEVLYPVLAGSTYEFSACIGAHRCEGYFLVVFYTAADAWISEVHSSHVMDNMQAGGAYADWAKAKLITKAPAGAAFMRIYFRLHTPYLTESPYLFISNFMMAATREGATETSPYVTPGLTSIGGGTIITNSVDASKIIADTITAREIKTDAIETRHIKAGAIETVHMDAGSINASVLVGQSIKAGHIDAGQITTSKLAIRSSNLAYNPDFSNGLSGWSAYYGSYPAAEIAEFGINTQWCPSGFKALCVRTTRTGAVPGTQFGFNAGVVAPDSTFDHYPVRGGTTYEFSAFMSNHRCTGWLYVDFVRKNANGSLDYLLNSIGVLPLGSGGGDGGSPDTYPRIKLIATAPAGATHAVIYFMGRDPVGPEPPYIFVSGFMMAACPAGTVETSPYVAPGITAIDGSGIITNSLQATKIVTGSITTRELNVGSIFADSAVISNISTRVLVAGAIEGDMVKATTIGANKLVIATSNYAYNADFAQGSRGWFTINGGGGNHGGVIVEPLDTYWCPAGLTSYVTRTVNVPTNAGGYYDIVNQVGTPLGGLLNYTASPGARYEISAYISAHRCSGRLVIGFINSSGVYFAQEVGSIVRDNGHHVGQSLEDWNNFGRSKVFVTAPAGTVVMNVAVRAFDFMTTPVAASAYVMVSGLMIAPLMKAGQTTVSPYVAPSMTTIDGGRLITDTVVARHIRSDAIETRHMTANTIDAKVLTGGTIVAGKLATNSVVAGNIVAESITAGKLLLSDTSNMLKNGYFLNGSSEGWTLTGDGFVDYADPALDPSGPYRLTSTTRHPGYSHWVDVTPGDWLYFSCEVYNVNSSNNAGIYIEYYSKAMTNGIGRLPCFTGVKGAWTRVEGRDQVPAGVSQVRVLPFADTNDNRCWWVRFQIRRASSASLIVDGAITARTLNAGEIFGTRGIFDSLTAGIASFGGLKADQIAAGAITTSKLAITSANMAFNPDLSQGARGWTRWDGWGNPATDVAALSPVSVDTIWAPSGLKAVYILYTKPLSQINPGASFGLNSAVMDAGGNLTRYPLTADFTYEVSCFMSLHRCQGRIYIDTRGPNGEYTGNFQAQLAGGGGIGGSQQVYPRAKLIFKAPANTASMDLYFMAHTISGDNPYIFVSGLMIAATKDGATETSPYVAPSTTLIDGGNVFTGTLHANKIVGESITAAQIGAGQITVDRINADQLRARIIDTDGLTASRIVVGNNRLSNWVSATDTTRIDGGHLAANSVTAQRLSIAMRPMTVAGINFEMQVDGNGNKTGWITWTGGYISYVGDGGEMAGTPINAGSVYCGFNETHIWWNRGWNDLAARVGGSDVVDSNRVPMAAWSHFMGLMVLKGGVQIDGDKIAARSIKAVRIGAGEIQTDHMSANTINGDRILAGTLSADKISTGSITAGQVNVGDWHFQIQGSQRRMRVYGNNSAEHVCIGDITPWVNGTENQTHFGIIIRDENNQEILRACPGNTFIKGAYIDELDAGKIRAANLSSIKADLGDVTAGQMRSADSKFVINLNGKYIAMWD